MRAVIEGGDIIEPLAERILGRTTAAEIINSKDNSIILDKGVIISEDDIEKIEKAGIDQVKVRSALVNSTRNMRSMLKRSLRYTCKYWRSCRR